MNFILRWIRRFLRQFNPWLGGCNRCGVKWDTRNKNYHITEYGNGASGLFPLCEDCWQQLSASERWPYYKRLLASWGEHATTKVRRDVYQAVQEGK